MIYTEKDTPLYLKILLHPQGKKKKSLWMILDNKGVTPGRKKTERSNQNFQAETKDKLFSSPGVDLRVIIMNSMLPFFFSTQRKKHPVPGTESDMSWFYFHPHRWHFDYLHNNTITVFLNEKPHHSCFFCDTNGSACYPTIFPASVLQTDPN